MRFRFVVWCAAAVAAVLVGMVACNSNDRESHTDIYDFLTAFEAAATGEIHVLRKCLEKDPAIIHKNRNGTLLHRAAEGGHVAIVELLISYGADPTVVNDLGRTPLHLMRGHFSPQFQYSDADQQRAVRTLIEAGADIRVKDVHGRTPRDVYAQWGRDHLIEVLDEYEEKFRRKAIE